MSDNNEALAEQLAAKHYKAMCAKELGHLSTIDTIASAVREALSAAGSQSVSEGFVLVEGAWQFFDKGEWHNGQNDGGRHRKNTEAAGYQCRDMYAAAPSSAGEKQG